MNGEGGDMKLRLEGCRQSTSKEKRINRRNNHVGGSWQERGGAFGGADRSLFSTIWRVWVQWYEMRLEE